MSLLQTLLLADAELTDAVPGGAELDEVGLHVGRVPLRLADDLLGRLLHKGHGGGARPQLLLERLRVKGGSY